MDKTTYLNVYEAAEYVGLHYQTIRQWIRKGRLPALKLGREFRVTKADLDAMYQPVHVKPEQAIEA
jgi:excisionase family DNA binding protein